MSIPNIGAILSSSLQIGGDAIESAVARAYLVKHVDDFDRVEFNVGLGPGITLPFGTPAYVQKSATASTRARADMILYRGDTATIVEVTDRLYAAVAGQLLHYYWLLIEDNPKLHQVYKVAAGQTVQLGVDRFLDTQGILVELYPGAAAAAGIISGQ